MNREDLKKKYNIFGKNKDISLYRKKGEYYYGIGYCGNIELKNGKATFNGKSYSDIESLDKAPREWEATLEFPVDTYNPMCNKTSIVEDRITWYIENKLGFKRDTSLYEVWFYKNIGPNCRLCFHIDSISSDENKIDIITKYSGVTYRKSVDDEMSGISFISSMMNCFVLETAGDLIDALSVCDDKVISDVDAFIESKSNIFGIEKVDFKQLMIENLENTLKQLKENN